MGLGVTRDGVDIGRVGRVGKGDALLGGAVVTETVFAWPGLSRYGVAVILRKDLNAIIGTVLIISAMFLIVNLIVDLMIAFLNPRIRYSERGST